MRLSVLYAAAVLWLAVHCHGEDESAESQLSSEAHQPLYSNSGRNVAIEERKFCKISKKCMSRHGKCIPKGEVCDGEIIKKGCKKTKNCKNAYICCAPFPTKPPTTTPDPNPAIISSDEFISKFNKTYASKEEEQKRVAIFMENVKAMEDHNKLYESGESSFLMGVNKYSDLTYEEVVSDLTGSKESNESARSLYEWYTPIDVGEEPSFLDYREKGAVNPIRDQGRCGSCWAFSAIGSIESNIYLKRGVLQELSEQELNDCDEISYGCNGGFKHKAIEYVANEGITFRTEYPYTGRDDTCKDGLQKSSYNVIGIRRVRYANDADLLNALVQYGPISVSVYVTSNFGRYRSGILVDGLCSGATRTNHAVVLVGYGTENGIDYWLIRNSWGESWGENGYIKLSRNVLNHCRISTFGFFPIIEDCNPQCQNGGTCNVDLKCDCAPGWKGDSCDIEDVAPPCPVCPTCPTCPTCQTTGSTINTILDWRFVDEDYFVPINIRMIWREAYDFCINIGLELYHPKNIMNVAKYLNANFEPWDSYSFFHVGGRGNGTHNLWLSGEVVSRDEPWISRDYEYVRTTSCLAIRSHPTVMVERESILRSWADSCGRSDAIFYFLCGTPHEYTLAWHSVGEDKFAVFNHRMNWEDSRSVCKQFGLDLYQPKDVIVVSTYLYGLSSVYDAILPERYWLGGKVEGDKVYWLSGEEIPRNASFWARDPITSTNYPYFCVYCKPDGRYADTPLATYKCEYEVYPLCG